MRLNCDLGEGLDAVDERVMPLIDMANIACGGHAGDEDSIQRCVNLASINNTWVGAHPAYPDRKNFGRISPKDPCIETLTQSFIAQLTWLKSACTAERIPLKYVKPHGALYHDAAKSPEILRALLRAMTHVCPKAPIMLQARPDGKAPKAWLQIVDEGPPKLTDRPLWFEAFADRAYTDAGLLAPRTQAGAVFDTADAIFIQAKSLLEQAGVTTQTGKQLTLNADSLCVHGDTPAAFEALEKIHTWRNQLQPS